MRQIKYFLAVADAGSFTRAADQIGIVQSAVSQQIARLERELGVTLFDRSTRTPTLTAAGLRFRSAAKQLVDYENDAKAAARGRERSGRIVVGVPGGLFHPIALVDGVSTVHLPGAERQSRVADGELDAAIIHGDEIRSDLLRWELPADPVVTVVSADHPLAHRRRVALAELQPGPLLLEQSALGTQLALTVIRACRAEGFEADVHSLAAGTAVLSAVRALLGSWSVYYAGQAALLRSEPLGVRFLSVRPPVTVPACLVVRADRAELGDRLAAELA